MEGVARRCDDLAIGRGTPSRRLLDLSAGGANGPRRYAQIKSTIVCRRPGLSWAILSNAYKPPWRTMLLSEPNCSTALTYNSLIRRSAASCSLAHCRLRPSTSVATAPVPAPTASATLIISSRSAGEPGSAKRNNTNIVTPVITTTGTTTTSVDHNHDPPRPSHHRRVLLSDSSTRAMTLTIIMPISWQARLADQRATHVTPISNHGCVCDRESAAIVPDRQEPEEVNASRMH
jgi:hypothetical protein